MANGRTAVGRYLTGGINKVLSYRELAVINEAGLHIIPIYQTTGDHASYFSENKGKRDAYYAYDALVKFKFPGGSTVYFAVDYDATVAEVNSKIIPYFKSIRDTFNNIDMHGYKIGIYAPRYVCTLVREAGYSVSSFVCVVICPPDTSVISVIACQPIGLLTRSILSILVPAMEQLKLIMILLREEIRVVLLM